MKLLKLHHDSITKDINIYEDEKAEINRKIKNSEKKPRKNENFEKRYRQFKRANKKEK